MGSLRKRNGKWNAQVRITGWRSFSKTFRNKSDAKEWNFQKNSPLKPEYFTYGSDKKVWWQCSNDHEHEWEAKIANRSRGGSHCSICRKNNILRNQLKLNLPNSTNK